MFLSVCDIQMQTMLISNRTGAGNGWKIEVERYSQR